MVSGHERRRPADLAEVGEALRLPIVAARSLWTGEARGRPSSLSAPPRRAACAARSTLFRRLLDGPFPTSTAEREAALELTEVSA